MNELTKYTLEFTEEQLRLIQNSVNNNLTYIQNQKYWLNEDSIKEYEALKQLSEYLRELDKTKCACENKSKYSNTDNSPNNFNGTLLGQIFG